MPGYGASFALFQGGHIPGLHELRENRYPYIAWPGILEKRLRDIRAYRSFVSLHLTATLLLHATLFLLKSTTIDGFHPCVSAHTH